MTVKEITEQFIHKPTIEMYMLANGVREALNDREAWSCYIDDIKKAADREPLLTQTKYWKESQTHYGRLKSVDIEHMNKEEEVLSKIDFVVEDVINKDSGFFKRFPITYIDRKDYYKERGVYNGKFVLVGKSIQKPNNIDLTMETLYDIYTDGEVFNINTSQIQKDIIHVSICNYSIVLLCTRLISNDKNVADQENFKMFI